MNGEIEELVKYRLIKGPENPIKFAGLLLKMIGQELDDESFEYAAEKCNGVYVNSVEGRNFQECLKNLVTQSGFPEVIIWAQGGKTYCRVSKEQIELGA